MKYVNIRSQRRAMRCLYHHKPHKILKIIIAETFTDIVKKMLHAY